MITNEIKKEVNIPKEAQEECDKVITELFNSWIQKN